MSLAANPMHPGPQQRERGRMWWLLLGALVAGQLFAFWLVCSHQVRKAEARQNEAIVQQMALSDCLQYIPGSTIASCNSHSLAMEAAAHPAVTTVTGAMPVSYSYR